MILNRYIITNLFLIIIFYLCGINVSAQNQTYQLNTFRLHPIYPNPFNPTTKIKFTIPSAETGNAPSVLLKVYDVLGNEVATLVNEEKPAGSYEVEFSVGQNSILSLSSGIYFYQLKADSYIETKKMVLIK